MRRKRINDSVFPAKIQTGTSLVRVRRINIKTTYMVIIMMNG